MTELSITLNAESGENNMFLIGNKTQYYYIVSEIQMFSPDLVLTLIPSCLSADLTTDTNMKPCTYYLSGKLY